MKEIAYLISHYIEAFIIFQYCHCIFKQKNLILLCFWDLLCVIPFYLEFFIFRIFM